MIHRINITHEQFEALKQLKLYITPEGDVIELPGNIIQDIKKFGYATIWYMPANATLPAVINLKVEES